MILTCPGCSTRYQADETEFPSSGRNVRCAKCGQVWHQLAPEPESEPEAVVAEPEPVAPPPREFEPAPRPQAYVRTPSYEVEPQEQEETPRVRSPWLRRLALTVGWLGLAAIVVLLGWAGVVYRQGIVTSWPQSASLYAKLGMKANASGLEIDDVNPHENIQDGQSVLEVTGTLRNISSRELPVPQIRVALTDDDKRELYHWTFAPEVMTLQPGQTARFVTRLASPPVAARHLDLRFARTGE